MKTRKDILSIVTIILLCITSIAGILSMDFTKSYEVTNQYGHTVLLYGAGLYRHDTYLRAPVSIGTDFCILFVLVPLFIYCWRKNRRLNCTHTKLKLIAMYGVSLYYSASISFGLTYNSLFLVYLVLFSCSLFGMFYHILTLENCTAAPITTGLKVFLILTGIAVFVAWFPDIIPTLFTGKPLALIGVYTTEITYILDMGIISPLCILCICLLQHKNQIGTIILAVILRLCWIIGLMMISQTALQILSNYDIAPAALITKSASFLILGFFAYHFERRLYQQFKCPIEQNKKKHRILPIIAGILVFVVLFWKMPYSPYHQHFNDQWREHVDSLPSSDEVCTAEEIQSLPEPLQRYSQYISLEGFPKYKASHILFDDTDFVFDSSSGKVLNMDYDLWLTYHGIERSAYCTSSMYGVPFDGIDYCTEDNQGGMRGILGKTFTIFDTITEQGYQAELISWLAESIALNPSVIISPYVTYETLDANHVKATVTYNGVSGTGVFTINDDGAVTQFYSDERQVETIDGVDTRIGWKCTYDDYQEHDGIKTVSKVESIKVFPDHELVYFSSDNFTIEYIQ